MEQQLEKYEEMLWQIIRYHNNDVEVNIKFTPDYGVPFYSVKLKIGKQEFHTVGRNLWKRYRYCVRILERAYGKNLYKHNSQILNTVIEGFGDIPL